MGVEAISETIPNVRASVRFYRGALGLAVACGSDNYGDEQAHLNGVEGAHLCITTLRPERGPGTDGRPYPLDARPNDIVHWQTTLLAESLVGTASAETTAGAKVVSRRLAELPGSQLGISRALLVRDPVGYALLLAAPRAVVARPGSR
jgi:catechol 2,3-dioxygenase-like lactoylglutathione lyase family enzyme